MIFLFLELYYPQFWQQSGELETNFQTDKSSSPPSPLPLSPSPLPPPSPPSPLPPPPLSPPSPSVNNPQAEDYSLEYEEYLELYGYKEEADDYFEEYLFPDSRY